MTSGHLGLRIKRSCLRIYGVVSKEFSSRFSRSCIAIDCSVQLKIFVRRSQNLIKSHSYFRQQKISFKKAKIHFGEQLISFERAKIPFGEPMISFERVKIPFGEHIISFERAKIPFGERIVNSSGRRINPTMSQKSTVLQMLA